MGATLNQKEKVLQAIQQSKVMAIVRLPHQELVEPISAAIVQGGISVLEVTSNTPGYDQEIQKIRTRFPDCWVGCGTVITIEIAEKAIDAGAQFLVTPHVVPEIVPLAQEAQLPLVMGALTPTEVVQAKECGADIIKLFPCGPLGEGYVRAIKGPFNDLKVMAVGGVNESNVLQWLKTGCMGVGIGGGLMKLDENGQPDITAIRGTAENLVEQIQQYHEGF